MRPLRQASRTVRLRSMFHVEHGRWLGRIPRTACFTWNISIKGVWAPTLAAGKLPASVGHRRPSSHFERRATSRLDHLSLCAVAPGHDCLPRWDFGFAFGLRSICAGLLGRRASESQALFHVKPSVLLPSLPSADLMKCSSAG